MSNWPVGTRGARAHPTFLTISSSDWADEESNKIVEDKDRTFGGSPSMMGKVGQGPHFFGQIKVKGFSKLDHFYCRIFYSITLRSLL